MLGLDHDIRDQGKGGKGGKGGWVGWVRVAVGGGEGKGEGKDL